MLRIEILEDFFDHSDGSSSEDSDHKDKKRNVSKSAKEKIKYLEINMIGATEELDTIKDGFKAIKNQDGKTTDSDHRFVYKIRGYESKTGVDLIFNKVKELSKFNQWQEALEESKEIVKTRVNRLAEAKRSVIASSGQNLDLHNRFSDKTMPERCVSRSRYSFKNRNKSSIRRSASQMQLPAIPAQQPVPPPPLPRKSDSIRATNHYSNDPTSAVKNEISQPSAVRKISNAPPIPRRSSPSNKGIEYRSKIEVYVEIIHLRLYDDVP